MPWDPQDHGYYDAVYWAADNGIAAGYSGDRTGYFGVSDDITRGQVVMFLWRAAGKPEPENSAQKFKDVSKSNGFFKAIQWASESSITKGYSDGTFGPNKTCTRGQCVTFLFRMIE